jgi:single-strand DNA-binding protein
MSTQENNSVRLVGRVSQLPEERELPSGDLVSTFRVIVPRDEQRGDRPRPTVDALECAAWTAMCRRSVRSWQPDDVVEVTGSLRRRFFAGATGRVSRVEVEVTKAKRIRRAGSA